MKQERKFIISNSKARTFKAFCRDMLIPTEITKADEKNKMFYCIMSENDFVEAKAFCDKFCKPEKAEEKCNREVIYIIIEETRIVHV